MKKDKTNSNYPISIFFKSCPFIDKVYIDGSCGYKTVAGVLLARFKGVGNIAYFYKDTISMRDPLPEYFSYYNVCSTNGPGFLITKMFG